MISAELLTRLETERWTPLPEKVPLSHDTEALMQQLIHTLAQAMNGKDMQ